MAMDDLADLALALVVDGNAVAGDMQELMGYDVTVALHRCASCGNQAAVATLLAYTGGPGTVLRCSICREIVIRLVRTPRGTYMDLRGAAFLQVAPERT
jgi:uncharacterized protein DUF6510